MIRIAIVALALFVSYASSAGLAHGQAPQASHGGQVQEAHENWVELVVKGDQVKLYVLDESRKPVPASRVSGTATVLIAGKPYKVQLSPMDDGLEGKLPVASTGKTVATVSLKVNDLPATARFNVEP